MSSPIHAHTTSSLTDDISDPGVVELGAEFDYPSLFSTEGEQSFSRWLDRPNEVPENLSVTQQPYMVASNAPFGLGIDVSRARYDIELEAMKMAVSSAFVAGLLAGLLGTGPFRCSGLQCASTPERKCRGEESPNSRRSDLQLRREDNVIDDGTPGINATNPSMGNSPVPLPSVNEADRNDVNVHAADVLAPQDVNETVKDDVDVIDPSKTSSDDEGNQASQKSFAPQIIDLTQDDELVNPRNKWQTKKPRCSLKRKCQSGTTRVKAQDVNIRVEKILWRCGERILTYTWSRCGFWVEANDDRDFGKVDGGFLLCNCDELTITVRPNAEWMPIDLRWNAQRDEFEGQDPVEKADFKIGSQTMINLLSKPRSPKRLRGSFSI